MESFEAGKTYEFIRDGDVHVYSRGADWQLTTWGEAVPSGTRFTVLANYWMPPGSDVVSEVLIQTDAQLRPETGEAERKLSVGRALLELGQVREVVPTVTDEQAEAVRQAIIARYRWWFEGDHDLSPLGKPEDLTIQRDERGHALISWEEGPDDWAIQVSEGGSTESDRVMIAETNQEFGGNLTTDEPTPVTFPEDVHVEPHHSFVLGVYPA